MKGKLRELTLNYREGTQNITVTVETDFTRDYEKLKDKEVEVEIKQYRKKRSRDANSFCWALCTLIGNAMHPPVPKEEIYRKAIREEGVYFPVPVRNDAVEYWKECWSRNGTGWFAEVTDRSRTPGYTLMFTYVGTSLYDTEQMSRVIEWLKDQCNQMELAIPLSKKQEEELMREWGSR